jgi:hypothetical protein
MLLSVTFVTDITLEWLHTLDWESTKTWPLISTSDIAYILSRTWSVL